MMLGRITLSPSLDSFLGRREERDDKETIRLQAETIRAQAETIKALEERLDEKVEHKPFVYEKGGGRNFGKSSHVKPGVGGGGVES